MSDQSNEFRYYFVADSFSHSEHFRDIKSIRTSISNDERFIRSITVSFVADEANTMSVSFWWIFSFIFVIFVICAVCFFIFLVVVQSRKKLREMQIEAEQAWNSVAERKNDQKSNFDEMKDDQRSEEREN